MEQEKRYCKFCNSVEITRKNAEFCGIKCRDKQRRIDLGLKFQPFDKECEHCGNIFTAQRKNAKYCCKVCTVSGSSKITIKKKNQTTCEKYSNLPICKICGHTARALHSHIKYNHNMSVNDYKLKFDCNDSALYHESYMNELSQRIIGENNPAYDHGGKYSPFSEKFIKYDGLDGDAVEQKISNLVGIAENSRKQNGSHNTHLEYYLKMGMTEDEARKKLSSRQTTFSLKKCIEKHGEEDGKKLWTERQYKWLNNFPKQNYSKISQELFKCISSRIQDGHEAIYATCLDNGKNNELTIKTRSGAVRVDFFYKNKIIEFDGDYWHSEGRGNVERDKLRDEKVLNHNNEYKLIHILERDYRNYPEQTVQKCLDFLNS